MPKSRLLYINFLITFPTFCVSSGYVLLLRNEAVDIYFFGVKMTATKSSFRFGIALTKRQGRSRRHKKRVSTFEEEPPLLTNFSKAGSHCLSVKMAVILLQPTLRRRCGRLRCCLHTKLCTMFLHVILHDSASFQRPILPASMRGIPFSYSALGTKFASLKLDVPHLNERQNFRGALR